jgi:hypothetical protein
MRHRICEPALGKKGLLAVLEERIWKQAVGNEQLCRKMSDTTSNAI